jgi:polar amino acid transport system ATP-binding protein/sulfate transport system ATP-binding protein
VAAPAYEYKETLLKVEGVSVNFGTEPVLRDVNLEIKDLVRPGMSQGQVVGLLGPSGMGKTTLFRVLAGLDAPSSGTVLIEKEGVPVHKGMVGVVAQSYPLFAHRTVLGNLLVAGGHSGGGRAATRQKAEGLLERFGLAAHASKYPCQLSGGQRQRVSIAQQFMCSEHFLLMDEPFSGLDLIAQENACEFIREMARSDDLKTFILVTHDVRAACSVADTIWLLGRDRDAQGQVIPGARIQAEYNLVERGIAWQPDVTERPEFTALLHEIRARFTKL